MFSGMAGPFIVDTTSAAAVHAYMNSAFGDFAANGNPDLMRRVFLEIENAFCGEYPGYFASDMQYHNFEHTLQATVCLVDILAGRNRRRVKPSVTRREGELCVLAALLHDVGFLKTRDDPGGTGAKYTFVHEQRSCAFARVYLATTDLSEAAIDCVCAAINSTGPRNKIAPSDDVFASLMQRCLVTADYLSQMAANDYPKKLPMLFAEFEEALDYNGVPKTARPFKNADHLLEKTPDFWNKFVLPLLNSDAGSEYRHLEDANGINPYLAAVERNIASIELNRSTSF